MLPRVHALWSVGVPGILVMLRETVDRRSPAGKRANARRAPGPWAGSLRYVKLCLRPESIVCGAGFESGVGTCFSGQRYPVFLYTFWRSQVSIRGVKILHCCPFLWLVCWQPGRRFKWKMRLDCAFVFWYFHGITYSRSLMRATFRPSWA